MKRRQFIKNGALSSSFLTLGGLNSFAANEAKKKHNFQLKYAPHLGMFKYSAGDDVIDQLHFMVDQGFTAFEDNEMRNRPIEVQEKMAKVMQERGLEMGVFVAHQIYWSKPNLTNGNLSLRDEFLTGIRESVEVAKRVNAKWVTVVPGYVDLSKRIEEQTANVIESLKQAAAILEPFGLIMVLEPLNFYNHAGQFLITSPQAYQICKAVNSPACKILFDVYHQQIQEGNLLPNIEKFYDEIAYFQVGDNPGRNEPTTGEINYKNVFKFIHNMGYKGIIGMEHGNSLGGKKGEQAVIDAYIETDQF